MTDSIVIVIANRFFYLKKELVKMIQVDGVSGLCNQDDGRGRFDYFSSCVHIREEREAI